MTGRYVEGRWKNQPTNQPTNQYDEQYFKLYEGCFLGATKHLYNPLSPSVGRLVGLSGNAFVRRSTRHTIMAYLALFSRLLDFLFNFSKKIRTVRLTRHKYNFWYKTQTKKKNDYRSKRKDFSHRPTSLVALTGLLRFLVQNASTNVRCEQIFDD